MAPHRKPARGVDRDAGNVPAPGQETVTAVRRTGRDGHRLLQQLLSGAEVSVLSIAPRTLADLAVLADREKVLLPLADWFQSHPKRPPDLASLVEARRTLARRLDQEEDAIHLVLNELGVIHKFLKGRRLGLLGGSAPRQRADIDLIVPDAAAAWKAWRALVDRGYELAAMSIAHRLSDDPAWTGTAVLGNRAGVYVEINFGDFHPHWCTRLHLPPGFWTEPSDRWSERDRDPYLSLRWTAAIFLAEMVERSCLSLRDLRDARALFGALSASDLEWLTVFAGTRGLVGELALLSGVVGPLRVGRLDRVYRTIRRRAPVLTRIVFHDYPVVRARMGRRAGWKAALSSGFRDTVRSAAANDKAWRMLPTAARLLNATDGSLRRKAGALSTLVPLNMSPPSEYAHEGPRQMAFMPSDGWLILLAPFGVFAAVSVPILTSSEYDRARRAAHDVIDQYQHRGSI